MLSQEAHSALAWILDGSSVYHRMDNAFETPEGWKRLKDKWGNGTVDELIQMASTFSFSGDTPRTDDDTPIKKAIAFHNYQIGLQYQPMDERHGKILPVGYGEFLGLISEHDGMNLDVYVGPDLSSRRVFAITQLNHKTGEFDEVKFFVGCDRTAEEIAKLYQAIMTPAHYGGIEEIPMEMIPSYQPPLWTTQKRDAIHPGYVAVGVGTVAALGGAAYLLGKNKKAGEPCGNGYINADYQCHKGEGDNERRTSSPAQKVLQADGALSPDAFQRAFDKIETTGFGERLSMINDFMSEHGVNVVSVTRDTTPEEVVELLDLKKGDVLGLNRGKVLALHRAAKRIIDSGENLAGFTHDKVNHVVVYSEGVGNTKLPLTNQKMARMPISNNQKVFSVDSYVKSMTFSTAKGTVEAIHQAVVFLHEMAHQVDNKLQFSQSIKPDQMRVSKYASENASEAFAEAFTLWALYPNRLAKVDPVLYASIESKFKGKYAKS